MLNERLINLKRYKYRKTVKSWLFSHLRIAEKWHQAANESMLARRCQKLRKGQSSLTTHRKNSLSACVCVCVCFRFYSPEETGTPDRLKKRLKMPVMFAQQTGSTKIYAHTICTRDWLFLVIPLKTAMKPFDPRRWRSFVKAGVIFHERRTIHQG